jgi:hypothetical protein
MAESNLTAKVDLCRLRQIFKNPPRENQAASCDGKCYLMYLGNAISFQLRWASRLAHYLEVLLAWCSVNPHHDIYHFVQVFLKQQLISVVFDTSAISVPSAPTSANKGMMIFV